jgi:hypothetical protein
MQYIFFAGSVTENLKKEFPDIIAFVSVTEEVPKYELV